MPQPPGTGTTHHCPGAKVKMYIRLGRYCIVGGCCRTHQLQCQEPECKGWIYLNQDRCVKCVNRAKAARKKADAPADEMRAIRGRELEGQRAQASRTKGKNPLKWGRK